MNKDKIKIIYDSLIDIQEKLLSLPDDIHLDIDPRDNESLENGMKFLRSYNNNLADFTKATNKISENLRNNFIIKRGNPLFSKKEQDLRVAEKMDDIFFIEVNLSANHIRNNIKQLLEYFSLNPTNMKIYLREDRDV